MIGISWWPPRLSSAAARKALIHSIQRWAEARSLPSGALLPPTSTEPRRYFFSSSGVIEAPSAWMVWATFSSTVIWLISLVMKASVLASVMVAGLAALGHSAGWVVAGPEDAWARTAPESPPAIAKARTETWRERRKNIGGPRRASNKATGWREKRSARRLRRTAPSERKRLEGPLGGEGSCAQDGATGAGLARRGHDVSS